MLKSEQVGGEQGEVLHHQINEYLRHDLIYDYISKKETSRYRLEQIENFNIYCLRGYWRK